MRTKTLLITSVLLAALMVLVMLIASWRVSIKLTEIYDREEAAHAAYGHVASLLVLTHEYALYSEERAAQQWFSHYDLIRKYIGVSADGDFANSSVDINQLNALYDFFSQLKAVAKLPDDNFKLRRKQFLLDQLLSNIQILSDSTKHWEDKVAVTRHDIQQQFQFLAVAIPLGMLIILAMLSAMLLRRVLYPIAKLQQAVSAVRKGDLSVRSDTHMPDELGDLSRTFDAMAIDMVSELRKEIAQRELMQIEIDKLHLAQAQTAKMNAIGQLTAGVAHDFNNILGAMMGYAELSRHVINDGKLADVDRYQLEIMKSGNRAKDLVSQMLTFSRSTPDANVSKAPVTLLNPVIKDAISLLRASIASSIEINFTEEKSGLASNIHDVNLHQIIFNLCLNARDAIGNYGKIDVRLSQQHIETQICISCRKEFAGDFVMISVHDSGGGIPDEILNNIFDPFFTTKGLGKGTGMGLSVVHGLVHSLKGHIKVETAVGKGSTISVLLPLAVAEQSVQPAEK